MCPVVWYIVTKCGNNDGFRHFKDGTEEVYDSLTASSPDGEYTLVGSDEEMHGNDYCRRAKVCP